MKLGIIGGGGLLGSTTAFYIGTKNVLEEIKLFDLRQNMAKSHAMDMGQALITISKTKVTAIASYEEFADCDIILNTASLPERNVTNRNEYLKGNVGVVTPICKALKEVCKKDVIIINGTNPVDIFNYVVWKLMDIDRSKVIGFSMNDTLRLKWATQLVTGKEYCDVEGYCIGEHGDGQIRLFEQMKYLNKPLILSNEERKQIKDISANWFTEYQNLESGRTSGWTSAVSLAAMIEAIATDSNAIIPCSAVLDGELGFENLSMGMPCKLGKEGIKEIYIPTDLTEKQYEELVITANKISDLTRSIGF